MILRTLGSNLTLFEQMFNDKAPSLFLEVNTVREREPSTAQMFEPAKSGEIRRGEADLETLWDLSPFVRSRRGSNPYLHLDRVPWLAITLRDRNEVLSF